MSNQSSTTTINTPKEGWLDSWTINCVVCGQDIPRKNLYCNTTGSYTEICSNDCQNPSKFIEFLKNIKQPIGYKCRVECVGDVKRLRNRLKVKGVLVGHEWAFNDRRTLKTIRKLMGECLDCHVAQQTVKPSADYTGERDFTI